MSHGHAGLPPLRRIDERTGFKRLAAAVERMLAKDRTGSFVTAAGVVAALHPFAADADLAGLSLAPLPSAIVAA
jgi:hypothetical protein